MPSAAISSVASGPTIWAPSNSPFWRRTGFHEAVRLSGGYSLANGLEWEFPHLVFHARFLEGAFRFTYGSHLRVAVRAAREEADLPGLVVRIKHALHSLDSFKRSRMCQQHAADHVACRINAGNGSRIAVIHLDESLSVNSRPGAAGTTGFTPMATRQTSAVISSSCPLLFSHWP